MSNTSNTPATAPLRFFGADSAENPFPAFAQLRAAGPLVPLPPAMTQARGTQGWVVTRMHEAVQVLKDPRFTVDASQLSSRAGSQQNNQGLASGNLGVFGQSMVAVDGLDHKRLRGLVAKAFTPK